ncbi:MAG: PTS transporter subunit EIIC [Eubacteriales bacterium]|nr:PTS transporter subunit EIIC [Eubacteriales bacterium]
MEKEKRQSVSSTIIDAISGIFLPIVNLLSAAGIMKGVLAILTTTGVLLTESETYLVLNAMGDSLFYFLPVLLAFTAGKKFGANPFTSVVIAGILLYPSLNTVLEAGNTVRFFGLPLKGVTYHSSVIPIILAAGLLALVEKMLNRVLPDIIKGFMVPLLSILIVGTITLLSFGPVGAIIGDGLAAVYKTIYGLSPIIAGLLLGAIIQPMVIFGFHWSFILIGMNNITVSGHDTVLALMGPAVFAQAGAALAVMLKSKDKSFQSICASAALSAMFGITEPAMFGVNLPRKKPMAAVCIGGGIGGALAGLSGAQALSFAFPSLASLPVFFGPGFGLYLVSCLAGFAVAFAVTMVLKFEVDLTAAKETV